MPLCLPWGGNGGGQLWTLVVMGEIVVVTSDMMVRGKSLYRDNVMFSLGMMAEILVLSSYDAIGLSEQRVT